MQSELEATKKKLSAGTQLPTNDSGQLTLCFGAGRFTKKPFLSAVVFFPASFGGTEGYFTTVNVANAGCASYQVWKAGPTGVSKAGAGLLVNLMAVEP